MCVNILTGLCSLMGSSANQNTPTQSAAVLPLHVSFLLPFVVWFSVLRTFDRDLAGSGWVARPRWSSATVYGQINSRQAGLSIRHYNPDCFYVLTINKYLIMRKGNKSDRSIYEEAAQSVDQSFRLTKQALAWLCVKRTHEHTHIVQAVLVSDECGDKPKVQTIDYDWNNISIKRQVANHSRY